MSVTASGPWRCMAKSTTSPFNPVVSTRQTPWLILCAGIVLVQLAPHLPLWLSLGAGAALLWRTWLWKRHAPLPPRWRVTLLVLAGTVAVFLSYKSVFGRDPGAALLALFLALKLMEVRTLRDGMTVVFLCYFLQIALFFHSQDPHMAALMVATSLFITATLITLNDDTQPAVFALRKAGLMLAQAAPIMLALFLLFPRIQGPLWGMPQDAYSGLSGLSDTMAPGSISDLTLSGAIAFRANFAAAPPPQNQLYWRGPVLTSFDGRAWKQGKQSLSPSVAYRAAGRSIDYTVTVEAHNKPWLFALELPAAPPAGALAAADYQLVTNTPVRTRQRFEMRSYPGLTAGTDETESVRRAALQLPPAVNPSARALALEWRAELPDDADLMRRALRYFREREFVYTLSPPLLGANSVRRIPVRDPARFLRALRLQLRLPDARGGRPGAGGHRLPGRRDESDRRLHDRAPVRRPRLGRGVARGSRLAARRPDGDGRALAHRSRAGGRGPAR